MTSKMDRGTYPMTPEDGGAVVLRSPLLMLEGVVHGFATRRGGVSDGTYASLNFGKKGGDEVQNVQRNLARLGARVGFDPGQFFRLSQVHGKQVVVVDGQSDPGAVAREEADALVTRTPGITVGVNTADCVPVLFADPDRGVVAAAHAGWRGVVRGVLQATAETMISELGCSMGAIKAAQGPCIGPCCYEVGEEVAEQFAEIPGVIIRDEGRPRPHLHLPAAVNYVLLDMGIELTSQPSVCTHCQDDVFFSYRRDGAATGHHLSVIGLERSRGPRP